MRACRGARQWARLGAMLAALAIPAAAQAGDTRYQDYVIGGRAIGLGGAFVSLADDASGIYYNPAGIADVDRRSASVSTSLYGFERGANRLDPTVPVTGLEELDVEFNELVIVPASAGYVQGIGEAGPNGERKHAYGVTVVVPSYRDFSSSPNTTQRASEREPLVQNASTSYTRHVSDRSLWAGAAYARKLTPRLRLGVSAFYVLRSTSDSEEIAGYAELEGADEQVFRSARNEVSYLNGNAVLMLGAKYQLSDRVAVGAAIQSPSLQLHSSAQLRFSRAISIPECPSASGCDSGSILAEGPVSRYDAFTLNNARSQTRYAPRLRLGAHYAEPYDFTLSADITYHAPVSYTLIDVDDPRQRQRLPFTPRVERRGVVNFNVGGEYLLVRQVSVAGGLFSNFSSAPPIPEAPGRDHLPDVDLWGVTMAVGYFGEHSLSRLGVVYSVGSGSDVVPRSNIDRLLEDKQGFRRVDLTRSFFYVFLSSTFRY